MTEIQKEEFRAAARERKKGCVKKKELRKSLLSPGTQFFVSNKIKSKICKISSCLKASVLWRSL